MTAVHTALDIRPAYEPKSYAEIVAADKERERKWRAAAQKRPVVRAEAIERQPGPKAANVNQRAHTPILALGYVSPETFTKRKCAELGYDHDALFVRKERGSMCVDRRDEIIRLVRDQYPKIAVMRIAAAVKMHETSVSTSLERSASGIRRRPIAPKERVIEMFKSGWTQKGIADKLGCTISTVNKIVRTEFPNRVKQRFMEDHRDEIEAAYREGCGLYEIGFRTGFDPSSIGKFIRRSGWSR
jgi:DNA-binding CsgD family transcriptional regulator